MSFGLVLAVLMFGPLLMLGLYIIADHLGWAIAGRILDMFAVILTGQFIIGALVNIVMGVALVGLAVWMVLYFASAWRFLGAAAITILGLWRAFRGATILRSCYKKRRRSRRMGTI